MVRGDFLGTVRQVIKRPYLSAALAAAIVLLVLGYPSFLGLYRLPQAGRQAGRLREELGRLEAESRGRIGALSLEYERKLQKLRQAVLTTLFIHKLQMPLTSRSNDLRPIGWVAFFSFDPGKCCYFAGK